MLYRPPLEFINFEWNGAHLFYVEKDGMTITKCVGDIKSAIFGKKLTSKSLDFLPENRQNEGRRMPDMRG